jgi:hypothetical protein
VLHCIAGPVDGETFLREARWAVEVWKMALLEGKSDKTARFRAKLARAHLDRLRHEHNIPLSRHSLDADAVTPARMGMFLNHHSARGNPGNAARVHLLLAAYPLPRLEQIYGVVFEKILNERLSTSPVVQR